MAVEKKSPIGMVMVFVTLAYILNGALSFVAPLFGVANPLAELFVDPIIMLIVGVTLTVYSIDYLMMVFQGKALLK